MYWSEYFVAPSNSKSFDRPKGKDLRYLRRTAGFLKPYWQRVIGAVLALTITAFSVLALGQGMRELIDTLRCSGGNQSETARVLGVSRITIWKRVKKYEIDLAVDLQ